MPAIEVKNTSPGGDACTEWMREWEAWPPLWVWQTPRNQKGRPIWEPPAFDYSEYIYEEYEKKRKALLKYTGGDVARATEIMDVETERWLLSEFSQYREWAADNCEGAVDSKTRKFFWDLWEEVHQDFEVVFDEWECFEGGIYFEENEDGTYDVVTSFAEDKYYSDHLNDNVTQTNPKIEHNRISSPTDDAEELAWLDSIDVTASTTSPPILNPTPTCNKKPLALRLVSLRSSANLNPNHVKNTHIEHAQEDELD